MSAGGCGCHAANSPKSHHCHHPLAFPSSIRARSISVLQCDASLLLFLPNFFLYQTLNCSTNVRSSDVVRSRTTRITIRAGYPPQKSPRLAQYAHLLKPLFLKHKPSEVRVVTSKYLTRQADYLQYCAELFQIQSMSQRNASFTYTLHSQHDSRNNYT